MCASLNVPCFGGEKYWSLKASRSVLKPALTNTGSATGCPTCINNVGHFFKIFFHLYCTNGFIQRDS